MTDSFPSDTDLADRPLGGRNASRGALGDRALMVVGVWLVFGLLNTGFALVSDPKAAAQWKLQLAYEGAWALAWAGLTLAIGQMRRALAVSGWSLARRIPAHGVALVVASVVDTGVRRGMSWLLVGPSALPFVATMLYFADATFLAYILAVALDQVRDTNRRLVAQSRRELALRAQLAHARLEQLQQQLQPHFLFNALGLVSELLHEAPQTARRVLSELATLVRSTLDDRRELVTLREELAATRAYLDIQRLRHADWLTIEEDVAPAALDVTLVRFILQPLVENAIRHGLEGRVAAGTIRISARLHDARLTLSVADNGVGLSQAQGRAGWGIGLASVRRRLVVAYGAEQQLTLADDPRGGTIAQVTMPASVPWADGLRTAGAADVRHEDGDGDGLAAVPIGHRAMDVVRRHPMLGITVAWVCWGLLWTQQSIAYDLLRHRFGNRSVSSIVVNDLSAALIWALLTPPALALVRRITRGGIVWAPAHVIVATLFAAAQALLFTMLRTGSAAGWIAGSASTMALSAAVYALFVSVAYQHRLREWLRERELASERLRAALAEAPLDRAAASVREISLAHRLEELAGRPVLDASRTERELAGLAAELRSVLDATIHIPEPEEVAT
jgi:two-component system, LytTR family, sensor kinase